MADKRRKDTTDVKQTPEGTHRETDRARTFLDIAGVMIVAISPEQTVSLINKKGCEVLGYAEDEILGKNWFDHFLPEEIREDVRSVFVNLIKGKMGEPVEYYENPIVTSSGEERLIAWHNSYLRDEDGTILSTLSSGEDITEVRRATEQLRYLATFPELNPFPIVEIDTVGNLTYVNAAAQELFPDLGAHGMAHPFLAGLDAFSDSSARGDRGKIPGDVRVGDRHYHRRIWHVPGQNHLRVYAVDITERKTAEEALRESVERYRQLVEASPDAIGVQAGGRIVFVNPAMIRLLGAKAPENLLGRTVMDFVHPDSRPMAAELIEETTAQRRVHPLVELKVLRADGKEVDVEIAAIPFTYDGEPGTQIVARDISERKEVEQLKSDFLAMVSHELRTPLAVVIGYATVIERALALDDTHRRAAEGARTIHERSTHMARLVDSLLDISQIQSGTFDLDLDVVDIEALVRTTAESTPRPAGHAIEIETGGAIPPVMCDPNRMSIAVTNLLSNAVKFSPEGGKISVGIDRREGKVRISVRDRGVGVAAKDRERIFDRFTQGDMSSTRAFGGVGMGLYVARRIAEAHGGSIELRSTKSRGSTFTIEVPINQAT